MVKKTKVPAKKKRKGEESGSSAGAKKQATGSSERTRSEVSISRNPISPSRVVEKIDAAGRKLTTTSASSEPDVAVTGSRPPPPVFPAGVESAIEDYVYVSDVIVKLLQSSVSKYNRAAEKVRDLAEDRARQSSEVASATVREEGLKKQLSTAETDLAAAKEKAVELEKAVDASRAREIELSEVQGDVFRALAERIFLSKRFSSLVASLTEPSSTQAVAAVLDRIAEDFPDLDKGKYGYRVIEDGEMLRTYGRALMKKTSSFPVVEELANRRTLLSPEEVRKCDIDRDVKFEALLGPMREELKTHPLSPDTFEDEEEEEEEVETATPGGKNADTEVAKTAEVQQPSSVMDEADLTGRVS